MCTYFLYIQDKKNVKHEGTDIENEKKKNDHKHTPIVVN